METKLMMQQVAMLVTFKVKPEMSDVLKQALVNDLTYARQEPGYVSMNLFAAQDEPNTLFLLERWQNQEAFDSHLSQPHTQAVLKLTETALAHPLEICSLSEWQT
ncbi:MAG TPA: putative quinol monooxygenase [Coleofasciculaceae cyanobacterium]